jgi:hypothetical protein
MEKKRDSQADMFNATVDPMTMLRLAGMSAMSGMSTSELIQHAVLRLHVEFEFQCLVFNRKTPLNLVTASVPAPSNEVREKTASPSKTAVVSPVVSIDESMPDQLRERMVAYVNKVIKREISEFIFAYDKADKGSLEEVIEKLNDATYRAARFYTHAPDDLVRQFSIAGQKCGLSASVSLTTVSKANSDARKKPPKIPNINNEPRAKARRFNVPSRTFDAADAAAGILDQLRGPRSSCE